MMMETKARTVRNVEMRKSFKVFTNYFDEQRREQKHLSDANKSMKTNISEKIEKFSSSSSSVFYARLESTFGEQIICQLTTATIQFPKLSVYANTHTLREQ